MAATPFLLFFLVPLLLLPPSASSLMGVSFDFASFSFLNLTLLGDSYLRNGTIGLTRETGVPSSSAGAAICTLPIRFLDPGTNASASFSTKFSFSITSPDPDASGDGLTFFVSPDNATLGSAGGYLGLFRPPADNSNGSSSSSGSIIAIEFDARLDEGLGDPSGNHVGLDVDRPVSKASDETITTQIHSKFIDRVTNTIKIPTQKPRSIQYIHSS